MPGKSRDTRRKSHDRALDRWAAAHTRIVLLIGCLPWVWFGGIVLLFFLSAHALIRAIAPEAVLRVVPFALTAIAAAIVAASVLRVRVEPRDGIRLGRNIAPTLHDTIDRLAGRLRAAPYRDVLLGRALEIRTVRVPRLGGLLGSRDYLVIGLPLMLALPFEHLRALLAHELAHRSRRNAIRDARVHRMRDRWLQAARSLQSRPGLATLPLTPFLRRFAPWYARLTLPVARAHELAADRRAAQATSRDDLAGAMLRLRVVDRFLVERFYPRLLADLRHYGVPPSGLYARFEKAIDALTDDPRFGAWLDAAVHADVAPDDQHPPLRRRLAALALGDLRNTKRRALIEAAFSGSFEGMSSARLCLAALPHAVTVTVEKAWLDDVQKNLEDRHAELLRLDARRRELERRSDLSAAELLDHAIATAETEGAETAIPRLRELVDRYPDMAPARFVLGTLLLRRNDGDGLVHIHAAVRLDPDLDGPGRELASEFLRVNQGAAEAMTATALPD